MPLVTLAKYRPVRGSRVANSSTLGKLLQGLVGYDAQPAGMQIAFFIAVLVTILVGMSWARRRSETSTP